MTPFALLPNGKRRMWGGLSIRFHLVMFLNSPFAQAYGLLDDIRPRQDGDRHE